MKFLLDSRAYLLTPSLLSKFENPFPFVMTIDSVNRVTLLHKPAIGERVLLTYHNLNPSILALVYDFKWLVYSLDIH
jgi:hypothetical protein